MYCEQGLMISNASPARGDRPVVAGNTDSDQVFPAHAGITPEPVLMGSYDWTAGATQNSGDLNLVSSPTVAAAYAAHWRERLAVSDRFDHREDWCWS